MKLAVLLGIIGFTTWGLLQTGYAVGISMTGCR